MAIFGKVKKKELEGLAEALVDVNDSSNTEVITKKLCDPSVADGDMARDLAYLVGDAITVWAKKYQLENMPRDIILDQAISILLTMRDFMK